MKSKIACSSHKELACYLQELVTYFRRTGVIPLEEGEAVGLPLESSVRIRFDKTATAGSIQITIDWCHLKGGENW